MHQISENKYLINETVKYNLQMVSSILSNNKKLVISDSTSSVDSMAYQTNRISEIAKLYPLITSLLQNINNPFKVLHIYSKLLSADVPPQIPISPLFQNSFFNEKIHGLLTCYLEDETSFYKIHAYPQKVVDVFYKFMYCQYGELMQANLKQGAVVNIGKWFFQEGLQKMFRRYYFTANQFTILIANFMLHGLTVLFIAAVSILGKKNFQRQLQNLETLKISYIKKYELQ